MKNTIIIIIIIAIIVGLAFFLSRKNSVESSTGIVLVKETGDVSFKANQSDQYTTLYSEDQDLANGSYIKTGEDSFARVFLPDNSLISIDENSEIQINTVDNKTDIQQLVGKTWNRVQTLTQGAEYKVKTANTIAAVRGTIFAVTINDKGETKVYAIEHTTNVGKHEEGSDKITEDVDLKEKKIAEIKDNTSGKLDIFFDNLTSFVTDSFWYRRNHAIDEEWKKIKDMEGVDLQKLLEENLQKRPDYEELKLGLGVIETDPTKIQDKLADVYKLSTITQNTCKEASQDLIQRAIDQVQVYRAYVKNPDQIGALLKSLKKACVDGSLNLQEAQELQTLVNAANE